MTSEATVGQRDAAVEQEVVVLQQYGLRWAVLAAWRDALKLRHVPVARAADGTLEGARIKIASGCFSVCEVGCDLASVEAALTSADGSTDHNWVDFWLDLLAQAMANSADTERLMKVPAVKFHYNNCGSKACRC